MEWRGSASTRSKNHRACPRIPRPRLSRVYGEPVETISEYLGDAGIASHHTHCGNCGEHTKDFPAPSFVVSRESVDTEPGEGRCRH